MRNFVLTDEGRKVYSFANRDINWPSFYMQEINTIIYYALLGLIWAQWLVFLEKRRSVPAAERNQGPAENAITPSTIRRLSYTFIHWQAASVLLAIAFLFFTHSYWQLVFRDHDLRYIIPAFTIHVLWGITWCLISMPLLLTWLAWQSDRLDAIAAAGLMLYGRTPLSLS